MASSIKQLLVLTAALLIISCANKNDQPLVRDDAGATGGGVFSFVVIGDTPYGEADFPMLDNAVSKIKMDGYPFIIHIGDYKGGRVSCTDDHDKRQLALIESLKPTPVFYTPGDNEWTDCDRNINEVTGERYSDLDRLARVRELFFSEPVDAPEALQYERQKEQVENATWVYKGVRFLTLHVTGTNNGRDWVTGDSLSRVEDEVTTRDTANDRWLKATLSEAKSENAKAVVIAIQADMTDVKDKPEDVMCETVAASDDHPCDAFTDLRAKIRDEARKFNGSVLVIHGDTAPFTLNQTFAGEEAPNLWRLNAAGDAGPTYGVRDVTLVKIDASAQTPFSARGLVTGQKPKVD